MSITSKDYYGAGDETESTLEALYGEQPEPRRVVICNADICNLKMAGTRKEIEGEGWQLGRFSAFCPFHAARKIGKVERPEMYAGYPDAAAHDEALNHAMAEDEWERYHTYETEAF